jgi:hypothetical protein
MYTHTQNSNEKRSAQQKRKIVYIQRGKNEFPCVIETAKKCITTITSVKNVDFSAYFYALAQPLPPACFMPHIMFQMEKEKKNKKNCIRRERTIYEFFPMLYDAVFC